MVLEVNTLRPLLGPVLAGIGLHVLALATALLLLGLEADQRVDIIVSIDVIELQRSWLFDVFTLSQI